MTADDMFRRRDISEADYAAWLERRMPEMADELTGRFAGVLPEGMRFEWVADGEGKAGGHGCAG